MTKTLETEWTAERKTYRDPKQNIVVAEARQNVAFAVEVRFYDDHADRAEATFRNCDLGNVVFPTWDAADFAILAIHNS